MWMDKEIQALQKKLGRLPYTFEISEEYGVSIPALSRLNYPKELKLTKAQKHVADLYKPGMGPNAIARATGIKRERITNILKALVEKGVIEYENVYKKPPKNKLAVDDVCYVFVTDDVIVKDVNFKGCGGYYLHDDYFAIYKDCEMYKVKLDVHQYKMAGEER